MGLLKELVDNDRRPISFDNVRILLADGEVNEGSIVVEDGTILSVCPESTPYNARRLDLEGKILMPGLIDLHSDAIEHEVQPRPGTILPFDLAVRQADRLFATVGVSTAFHSLSFWGDDGLTRSNKFNAEFSRAIASLNGKAIIDNRVHLRFEVTNAAGLSYALELLKEGIISLGSVMDHTPGQGQYADTQKFLAYLRTTGMTDAQADELLAQKQLASQNSRPSTEAFIATARHYGVPVAGHDEDVPEKVRGYHEMGVRIAEFPMTTPAAATAIELGHTVLVGSPNVMRGGSTGTGPSAMDLISSGHANALCSDYTPATILPAIFKISETLDWPLWRAVRLATVQPAFGVGMHDRGEIAQGKRADLIVVEFHHDWPIVRHLWSAGHLSYASVPVESPSLVAV